MSNSGKLRFFAAMAIACSISINTASAQNGNSCVKFDLNEPEVCFHQNRVYVLRGEPNTFFIDGGVTNEPTPRSVSVLVPFVGAAVHFYSGSPLRGGWTWMENCPRPESAPWGNAQLVITDGVYNGLPVTLYVTRCYTTFRVDMLDVKVTPTAGGDKADPLFKERLIKAFK